MQTMEYFGVKFDATVRVVHKERLTKRGLVSLLDYYQKVAHI